MFCVCLHVVWKDYSAGFGGKYGVQKDRQDKSSYSWEEKEKLAKHASQKGCQATALYKIAIIFCRVNV